MGQRLCHSVHAAAARFLSMTRVARPSAVEPPDDFTAILKLLRRERRQAALRMIGGGLLWFQALCLLIVNVAYSGGRTNILLLLVCLSSVVLGVILLTPARSRALVLLTERQDTRAIGPLLDALDGAFGARAQEIETLLVVLLPRLRTSDASLLTAAHRRKLCRALALGNADRELPYLLAIIQALEQIGGAEAEACLQRLIGRGAITPGQQSVLKAAQECLPLLTARLEEAKRQGNLLRLCVSS